MPLQRRAFGFLFKRCLHFLRIFIKIGLSAALRLGSSIFAISSRMLWSSPPKPPAFSLYSFTFSGDASTIRSSARVPEERLQSVIIGLQNLIVFVIVTPRAANVIPRNTDAVVSVMSFRISCLR
jgi:hypothetical protein